MNTVKATEAKTDMLTGASMYCQKSRTDISRWYLLGNAYCFIAYVVAWCQLHYAELSCLPLFPPGRNPCMRRYPIQKAQSAEPEQCNARLGNGASI